MFKRALAIVVLPLATVMLAHAAGNLPDPMRPDALSAAPQHGTVPGWSLNSILISAGRRLAVINGRTVAPGDTVSGARVLEISAGAVKLSAHGKTFVLNLIPESVKHVAHQ